MNCSGVTTDSSPLSCLLLSKVDWLVSCVILGIKTVEKNRTSTNPPLLMLAILAGFCINTFDSYTFAFVGVKLATTESIGQTN